MTLGGIGAGLAGLIGTVAAILAVATVWLVMTDPVNVASAVSEGSVTAIARELMGVLLTAIRGILHYI